MSLYTEYFNSLDLFKQILNELESKKRIEISGTDRQTASLISLCLEAKSKEDIVIACENIYQAQKVFDDLSQMNDNVYFYPKDDFIATELLTESQEFKLERVHTLKAIFTSKKQKIIVTSVAALLNKVPLKNNYIKKIQKIHLNDTYKPKELIENLVESGYERCYTVEKQGDIALRGSILDVFPINENKPYRIDFFGNDVDSIKELDTESQRSKNNVDEIVIMPKDEVFFSGEEIEVINFYLRDKLSQKLTEKTREKIEKDLENLNETKNHSLLQKYLSIFIKEDYSFIDYIENKTVLFFDKKAVENQEYIISSEIVDYLSAFEGYLKPSDFLNSLSGSQINRSISFYKENKPNTPCFYSKEILNYEGRLDLLIKDITHAYKDKTIIISTSDKSYDQLEDYLKTNNVQYYKNKIKKGSISIIKSPFDLYFDIPDVGVVSITEEKIFKTRRGRKSNYHPMVETKRLKSISELKFGDYVVHYDYGVGKFIEIVTKTFGSHKSDYIHIQYDKDDSLFIPVENLSDLSKYCGGEGFVPKLSKLNSKEWQKTREKARDKASSLATELLDLYSTREQTKGFLYPKDDEVQKEFEQDFDYELTADQTQAIKEIKSDMENGVLMDRLVCGDVGFGKTEVAIRAAFKAVLAGKQVAYLAPTTILARQHFHTFKERMDKYGVEVGLVSRFVKSDQIKKYLRKLQEGSLDIIIGTHRLLSKDVVFKDLGLLIIDEEQRFGVESKEQLKKIKTNVDVLTLTATPIPRTLQMAITGIKNISLIETAPKERYPIQTYVLERNDYVVKDAIERELSKGGQVFYLYNRVEDIDKIDAYLRGLVPEARIATIHGKMSKELIERTIQDFIDKETDVLISTTIIETGIDIPNVNTLIVHDSERYGLSQLYQIKGRVGRSNKISYAYLMYDKNKNLSEDASKRLKAIKDFTELGSGFKIAIRDLSTRGAGEVLGREQSGFMNEVGVELYLKLLDEEIKKKQGKEGPKKEDDIHVVMSRYIDENYISDDYTKIEIHTKISTLSSEQKLQELKRELEDRFGEVKPPLLEYMYTKLFENLANKLQLERVDIKDNYVGLVVTSEETKDVDAKTLFKTASDISYNFRFFFKTKKIFVVYDSKGNTFEMYKDLVTFIELVIEKNLLKTKQSAA